MKHSKPLLLTICISVGLGSKMSGQWTTGAGTPYLQAGTTAVNVGANSTAPSHLTVSGDQLGSGEVFRTNSPQLMNTWWRMFQEGQEVGNIWATYTGNEDWFVNAVSGSLVFQTATTNRGRFNQVLPGQLVNGFGGLDLTGYFGVGAFGLTSTYFYPVARIHSDRAAVTEIGFRGSMQDGTLITRDRELTYNGLLAIGDAGTIWSRETSVGGTPSPYRFVYTGSDGSATTASSTAGLEIARLQPETTLNEGYFGIGDWFNSGGQLPAERLDVLDRTIRLRGLPVAGYQLLPGSDWDRVMVVTTDGTVKWRSATTIGGGGGVCDWNMSGLNNDVSTAWTGNPCVPQDAANVGIGTSAPAAKLEVVRSANTGGATDIGTNVRLGTNTTSNIGVLSTASGMGNFKYGVYGLAFNLGRNWGLYGRATSSDYKVGVYGEAVATSCSQTAIAVWGYSPPYSDASCIAAGWAAYFQGRGYLANGPWATSDQSMKQNILPIPTPMDIINQLNPKVYNYDTLTYAHLGLPSGQQFGLLAHELDSILPDLVIDMIHPAMYDSLGVEIHPEIPAKAVNYQPLITLNIAGMKQLNSKIESLEQVVSDLQSTIANCCTALDSDQRNTQDQGANTIGYIDNTLAPAGTDVRALRPDELVVTPNPFTENPAISYRIGTSGRVQLRVSDANGRDMGVLFDTGMQAGEHTMVWNTEAMAAGTYWLTLTLDGKRITEQAVKVE